MMKLNHIYQLGFLVTLFALTGCSSMYLPNVPATPMLRNQGEAYLATHVNFKGNINGTFAVAATDHIAVLANASYLDYGAKTNEPLHQWLVEGAVGYFTKMGRQQRQVLEFYGGYGVGHSLQIDQRATTQGYEPVERRDMDFNKIFVQANYSSTRKQGIRLFGEQKELNFGTAIRLSRIAMDRFELNHVAAEKEENFLIEPVFYTRLQLVKGFQLQYTSGFNIGLNNNPYLKAGNSVHTFGLVYNFWKK